VTLAEVDAVFFEHKTFFQKLLSVSSRCWPDLPGRCAAGGLPGAFSLLPERSLGRRPPEPVRAPAQPVWTVRATAWYPRGIFFLAPWESVGAPAGC